MRTRGTKTPVERVSKGEICCGGPEKGAVRRREGALTARGLRASGAGTAARRARGLGVSPYDPSSTSLAHLPPRPSAWHSLLTIPCLFRSGESSLSVIWEDGG